MPVNPEKPPVLPPMMSLKPPTLPSLLPLAASLLAPTSPPDAQSDNTLITLLRITAHASQSFAADIAACTEGRSCGGGRHCLCHRRTEVCALPIACRCHVLQLLQGLSGYRHGIAVGCNFHYNSESCLLLTHIYRIAIASLMSL